MGGGGGGGQGELKPPKFLATEIFWVAREIWAKSVFKELSKSFYYFEEIDIFSLNQINSQETVIG